MSTRQDFLTTVVAAVVAPTARPVPTPIHVENKKPKVMCPGKSDEPAKFTFDFDQTRFSEILAKSAQHRQCFGIMKLNDGTPLESMDNSIQAYEDFLKEGPGAMHAVAVLYHGASIGFAMNDTVWNEYLIPGLPQAPTVIRQDVGTVKRGRGNPFKDEVGRLAAKGASFFVCHNAIAGFSQIVAATLKADPQKVHAGIMAGILPGAQVVPAGVMAINACQEAKFTYIAT